MTRLFALLLVIALITLAFSVQGSRLGRDWVISRLSAYDGGYEAEDCESDLVASFNEVRKEAGMPEMVIDEELQAWLKTEGGKVQVNDTKKLLNLIQESDLCYTDTLVVSASAVSKHSLVHEFDETASKSNPSHGSIGTVVRPVTEGYGYEVLLVVGKKLKAFKPELLSAHDTTEFAATCIHCKAHYGLHAKATNGGLYLRCPKCNMNGGVLATDALGSYRWANEFLVGYQPPALFPPDITREHEMFIIWNTVTSDCVYRTDRNEPGESRDIWQTGLETMVRGQGDCEDTSVLLTDWLIARGFNARMAIGQFNGSGHAWCVVRLDGVEYLLESTNPNPDLDHLPYAEKVGAGYDPTTLFDRDYIYVPAKGVQHFKGLYFSDEWTSIKPRARDLTPATTKLATTPPLATGPKQISLRPASGSLKEEPTAVRFPDLARLSDIAGGSDQWQLTTPFAATHKD